MLTVVKRMLEWLAILILDKVDFKSNITKDKKGHFFVIKVLERCGKTLKALSRNKQLKTKKVLAIKYI